MNEKNNNFFLNQILPLLNVRPENFVMNKFMENVDTVLETEVKLNYCQLPSSGLKVDSRGKTGHKYKSPHFCI